MRELRFPSPVNVQHGAVYHRLPQQKNRRFGNILGFDQFMQRHFFRMFFLLGFGDVFRLRKTGQNNIASYSVSGVTNRRRTRERCQCRFRARVCRVCLKRTDTVGSGSAHQQKSAPALLHHCGQRRRNNYAGQNIVQPCDNLPVFGSRSVQFFLNKGPETHTYNIGMNERLVKPCFVKRRFEPAFKSLNNFFDADFFRQPFCKRVEFCRLG